MKTLRRSLAIAELLLIFPAVLFMTALFMRNLQPQQYEPARTAQRIVDWYAAQPHLGLWVLLIACPLLVLAGGCVALARVWRSDPALRSSTVQAIALLRRHLAMFLVAAATAGAAAILAIVALHLITG
jgi:hypothetical protein